MNAIVLGPIIFGLIFGFIIGTQIRSTSNNAIRLTAASFIVIIIAAIVMAWKIGQFPFYDDLPINTAFLFAFIGLLLSNLICGRRE